MLPAPEFVIAEVVELLHEVEVATKLQHRMLADRAVRGEEGSEFQARHGISLRMFLVGLMLSGRLVAGRARGNRQRLACLNRNAAMRGADGSPAASGCRPQPSRPKDRLLPVARARGVR